MKSSAAIRHAYNKLNNKVENKEAKEHKLPKCTITQHKNGRCVYLRVYDKDAINKKHEKGKQVVLAKVPLDVEKIPCFNEFIELYTTEEAKNDRYTIVQNDYCKVIKRVKEFNEIIKDYELQKMREKTLLEGKIVTKEVSSLAAPIHEVADMIDKIEGMSKEGLNAIEAQDLHQAIDRINRRLNAMNFSVILFNEYLHRKEDENAYSFIKNKHMAVNIDSKKNLLRLVKYIGKLTSLKLKENPKPNRKALEYREKIEELGSK